LAKIAADETPFPLSSGPSFVVHFVPYDALDSHWRFDPKRFSDLSDELVQLDFNSESRINFDGYVATQGADPAIAYVQFFRNGVIEFASRYIAPPPKEGKHIWSAYIEKWSVDWSRLALGVQQRLNVEPPIAVLFSLMGVRGYLLSVGVRRHTVWNAEKRVFDREDISVPPALVQSYDQEIETIVSDPLNTIWQASGWGRR
jgi:hypothetical protein